MVGRLSAEQLAQMRELAAATGSHVRDGRFGDVEGFIDASHAFHRFLVDATGVRSLVEAYEQLSLPDLMAQALPNEADTDPHLVTDHFDLVDALERADLPAVRKVLDRAQRAREGDAARRHRAPRRPPLMTRDHPGGEGPRRPRIPPG